MEFTYSEQNIKPFEISRPVDSRLLHPHWMIFPGLDINYGKGLTNTMMKRKLSDNVEDVPIGSVRHSRSIMTCAGKGWYRRHLNERYRLKYIGPLPKDAVKKMSCYGVDLLGGVGLEDDNEDPFQVSLKHSALAKGRAIETELDFQRYLRDIFDTHHHILQRLFISRSLNHENLISIDPTSPPLFSLIRIDNTNNRHVDNNTTLRTMAMAQTTPCPDILAQISLPTWFQADNKFFMVQEELFDRRCANLWTYEHKRQIGKMTPDKLQPYHWMTCSGNKTQPALIIEEAKQSGCSRDSVRSEFTDHTARMRQVQRDGTENPDKAKAKDVKIKHEADLEEFYTDAALLDDNTEAIDLLRSELDIQELNFSEVGSTPAEKEELTQVSNLFHIHLPPNLWHQLWTEMVTQGLLIAFVGDWIHNVHLCIRIPKEKTLLISDPISNPLVPQKNIHFCQENEENQDYETTKAIFHQLDTENHPWINDTDRKPTVLEAIRGASLLGLRLLCTHLNINFSNPSGLFHETSHPRQTVLRQRGDVKKKWYDDNEKVKQVRRERIRRITALQRNARLAVISEDARDSYSGNSGIFVIAAFFQLPACATDDDHDDTPGGSDQYPGDTTSRVGIKEGSGDTS